MTRFNLPLRLSVLSALAATLAGCSSEVKLKQAPVNVTGKVVQSGRPIGGVMLVLHPLSDGHLRELPVQTDGTFSGELVSGKYAYYVAKPSAPGSNRPAPPIAPSFFQADISRTLTVEPGKPLEIALD